ncbi:MAG TPA: carboxypeptidase-like regulatory domain-containing protein [Pilimelia sp.]|nr:carboxypeptidase-like regulatory domain-containing protein [Pilimelia sp.]
MPRIRTARRVLLLAMAAGTALATGALPAAGAGPAGAPADRPAALTTPVGGISVRVTDEAGAPLPGAVLSVPAPEGGRRTATADADGVATLTDLPFYDRYDAEVAGPDGGYATAHLAALRVAAGQVTEAAVRLVRAAQFHFRFADARSGAPATARACVYYLALDVHVLAPGARSPHPAGCGAPDGRGRLTVGGLAPGRYRFLVVPGAGGYGAQWVGAAAGTGDQDEARIHRGRADRRTTVRVRWDGAGTVGGRVWSADGWVRRGVIVSAAPQPATEGDGPLKARTDRYGVFRIAGLGPYRWKLQYTNTGSHARAWSGGAASRDRATPLEVRVGEVTSHDVHLPDGGMIMGTLTLADGGDPLDVAVTAVDAETGDFASFRRFSDRLVVRNLPDRPVWLYFARSGPASAVRYHEVLRVGPGETLEDIHVVL